MSTFVVEHVSSFVIRCSFCKNTVRQDVPPGKEGETYPRGGGPEIKAKNEVAAQASASGWTSANTTHNVVLNFCIDHVNLGIEMGLLTR